MSEEKEIKGVETKATGSDSNAGDKPKGYELVKQANNASERLETAIQRFKEENERLEENIAQAKLGGFTSSGQNAPAKPKELTAAEYADKVMKGEIKPTE